jgi:type IV pilus assembly protein PilM
VIVKRLSLPAMSDAELNEAIPWEAEQYIPFDLSEVQLDYQVVSPKLESCVQKAEIYTAERFSDHAPLIMDYDRDW